MIGNLGWAITNPGDAWKGIKGMGTESWSGLVEFWDNTTNLTEKIGNLASGDGFLTDEEIKNNKIAEQLEIARENIKKLIGEENLSKLSSLQKYMEDGDEAGLRQFLDSPDGKFLVDILNRVANNTLKDIKDFKEDNTKYPNQLDVKCDNPQKACTFTSDYIVAMLLTSLNMVSIDETARLAKVNEITNSNMRVSDNTEIARLSGALDVIIDNWATYIDTNKTPVNKSNADATTDWINTLDNGGKLVIRVGHTPGEPVGHSLVVQDYYVNSQGKIEFVIIDPERIYNRYDPQTKQIFRMDGNERVDDEKKRTIINYLKARKK